MSRPFTVLRLARPLYVLLAALTYVLGVGIAHFLGHPQSVVNFWLGMIGVVLAQTTMSLLAEVFRPSNEPIIPNETVIERRLLAEAALYVSIASLAATAVIALLLYRDNHLTSATLLLLLISLVVVLIYSVPPLRLFDKGFGELLLATHLCFVVPSIAFLIQAGSFHRLLNAVIIPLTFLALAMFLALDFPTYSGDLKYARRTLLARIGWERAVPLHHGLVVAAYLLFAAVPLSGFSLALVWPAFLTLPFALFQIYWLHNIALGAKPIWNLLTANAISLLGLTTYFLTLTFWLR